MDILTATSQLRQNCYRSYHSAYIPANHHQTYWNPQYVCRWSLVTVMSAHNMQGMERNLFPGAGRIWKFGDWWPLGAVDHMAAPAMLTLGTYVCTKTPIYFSYMGFRSEYIAPKWNKSPILVRCVYLAGILWCIFKTITIFNVLLAYIPTETHVCWTS